MKRGIINPGISYAIISAILFGASTPFAKYFLTELNPWLLAGLFYLGSGLGILLVLLIRYFLTKCKLEAKLKRSDLKWLLMATLSGGVLGPILLMFGLTKIPASTASLLLNFESIFTVLIAWLVLKEHTSRRLILGMVLILMGGFILNWTNNFQINHALGAIFIAAACLMWAVDNNLTHHISAADPLVIVCIKTTVAGIVNIIFAFILGTQFSLPFNFISLSLIVGFICYGVSLICFVYALRFIGIARTSAYFSAAPFIGALFAIIFLKEPFSIQLGLASILMGWGLWLHLTEHHDHEHFHQALVHEHLHTHDEHHQHNHQPSDPTGEPHNHPHKHELLLHRHPHFPDSHHRHKH